MQYLIQYKFLYYIGYSEYLYSMYSMYEYIVIVIEQSQSVRVYNFKFDDDNRRLRNRRHKIIPRYLNKCELLVINDTVYNNPLTIDIHCSIFIYMNFDRQLKIRSIFHQQSYILI